MFLLLGCWRCCRTLAAGEEIGRVAEQMAVSISLGQLAMVDERYR